MSSRNIFVPHTYNGQSWFDNIEDPYLRDFYAAAMTNYSTGYIDDHVYVAADHYFAPRNYHYDVSRNVGNHYFTLHNLHHHDPYLWDDVYNQLPTGEFIDGVYVTNESDEFVDHHQAPGNYHYVSRNISDHNYFAFTGHQAPGQSSFDRIEDRYLWDDDVYNQPTGEFVDGVYATYESEFTNDDYDTAESESIDYDVYDIAVVIVLVQHLVANMEGNEDEDEEEVTEETIENMMKTRTHCGTDDGGETCVICQCDYENDETIGALECQHEYHASCIKQWLLKGKRTCPICRSSVLPS